MVSSVTRIHGRMFRLVMCECVVCVLSSFGIELVRGDEEVSGRTWRRDSSGRAARGRRSSRASLPHPNRLHHRDRHLQFGIIQNRHVFGINHSIYHRQRPPLPVPALRGRSPTRFRSLFLQLAMSRLPPRRPHPRRQSRSQRFLRISAGQSNKNFIP
jgi:hypothetical protein